jgi:hypothetical protein
MEDFKDITVEEKCYYLESASNREVTRLDKKIADLEAEIDFLKRLLAPKP